MRIRKAVFHYVACWLLGVAWLPATAQRPAAQKNIGEKPLASMLPNRVNNRYALLIGINDYQYPAQLHPLGSCIDDVNELCIFMKGSEFWSLPDSHIRRLLGPEATKAHIEAALQAILATIQNPADATFYFYYSGHGAEGALLPYDADPGTGANYLSYAWLKQQLNAKGIGAKLFFLDTCHAGSFMSAKGSTTDAQFNAAFEQALQTDTDRQYTIFAAVDAFNTAAAGPYNSLYTQYLMQALRCQNACADANHDCIITAGEVQAFLTQALGRTATRPVYQGNSSFALAVRTENCQATAATEPGLSPRELYTRGAALLDKSDKSDTQSRQTGFAYVSRAAASSYGPAMDLLGELYFFGEQDLAPRDFGKARDWLLRAAAVQDATAMLMLGVFYDDELHLFGDDGKQIITHLEDRKTCLAWYRKAADAGRTEAMLRLADFLDEGGLAYQDGRYVDIEGESPAEATMWYRKAAEAGDTDAMCTLAGRYMAGKGTVVSNGQALYWYNKATSDPTNGEALMGVAGCYEKMQNTPQNQQKAIYYYQKAYALKYAGARQALQRLGALN